MSCCKCDSERLLKINAKSSDLNNLEIPHLDIDYDGYLPTFIGVCSGDYIYMTLCLDCGQIQNFKTIYDEQIREALRNGDEDDEDYDGGESWNQLKQQEDADSDDFYDNIMKQRYG